MISKRTIAAAVSVLLLCGCRSGGEYPEGVDTLPSAANTGTGEVITVYDTSSATLPPPPVTSSKTSPTTASETTLSSETTAETAVSESVTEETSVCETVTEAAGLDISDVPDVGISEYYEKTQTTPTFTSETEFSPSVVAEITTGASDAVSETNNTASVSAEETAVQTTAVELISKNNNSKELSPYTGKPVITHPYSYYTLDEKYRSLYDKLVDALDKCETSVDFSTNDQITFSDIFDTYQLIYNDQYTLFYISPTIEYVEERSTGYITTMKLKYNFPKEDIEEMKKEIENEADKILSKVNGEMSDYENVKLFHDSVITSCKYSGDAENPNNIYGCLVDKEALCQAYSQTFTYLCHRAGINALVVLGVANEPHMWNLVEMDGEYYHIDLTWDDPDRDRNPDSVRYDYFGLTDERIRELRQVDDYDYEVPAANGTKYHYYYFNGLVAADIDEARQIISDEAIKAARTGSSTVQFMCSDDKAFEDITSVLFGNSSGNVITVLDSVKDSAARRYNTESVYHNSNKNTRTVKIFLDYLD